MQHHTRARGDSNNANQPTETVDTGSDTHSSSTLRARPASRADFEIAIICALPIECDAVLALFDRRWDEEGPRYGRAAGDRNAYSTGAFGRHNVVLLHMAGMGKSSAAGAASSCRFSFPNIRLALLVGVCGVVPASEDGKDSIFLGDVVVGDGVIQYDFGRRFPEQFRRKDTVLDSLGRPNEEIRGLLSKLKGVAARKMLADEATGYLGDLQKHDELVAGYPGVQHDVLFKANYRHLQDEKMCDTGGCNRSQILRHRRVSGVPRPSVHFGLFASGDAVMKSGEDRDRIAKQEKVIAFEMEGAGLWEAFPCVVIKGACDYADSHKTKAWQRHAAATAAACAKAFLDHWEASNASSLYAGTDHGRHFEVPFQPNKKFVGREAMLQTLRERLFDVDSPHTLAIVGLGGAGKTQVALQMAYWAKEHKPECSVFWLPALSMPAFDQGCAELARELGLEGPDKEDPKELLRRYLESARSGDWLLIVDNADDRHTILGNAESPGLQRYLPKSAHGRLLFTTRSMDVALAVADDNVLELAEMSEGEARDFLKTLLPRMPGDEDSAAALLQELTCLPLAISQAAAYIKRNKTTIPKYLSLLRKTQKEAIGLLSREFPGPNRYEASQHAVATAWLVSFEQIRRDDRPAADLLSFMSQVEPRAIPQSLLPMPGTEEELVHAVGTLKGYALLQEREDAETFDMHRLVHLAIRGWIDEGGTAEQVRMTAVAHAAAVFRTDDWDQRERWTQQMPHVLNMIMADADWGEDECHLGYWSGRCLQVEGRIVEAVKLLEQVVAVQEKTLAKTHPSRLASQHELAGAYRANGQVKKAVDLLKHVVAVQEKTLAEDHPDRLGSQHSLAGAYRANGQVKKAVDLLKHVVAVQEKTLAEDHPDRLASQHALAIAYEDNGQVKKAVDLLKHVVAVQEKTLAEDHPDRLASQHALAEAYRANGQVKKAVDLLKHVVAVQEKTLAEDHPSRLASQHALAIAYEDNGQVKKAVDLLKHVVAVQEKTLAEDHPDRLGSQHSLAIAYRANGQVKKAVDLLKHVVAVQEKALAEDHPSRLASQHALAIAYEDNGQVKKAVDLLKHVVAVQEKTLAEDHPDRLGSQHSLAIAYRANGQVKKAVDLLKHVVAVQEKALAEDHPDRLASQHSLAGAYRANGQVKKAVDLLKHVVAVRETTLAEEHPSRLASQHALAIAYEDNGQVKKAVDLLKHVVAVQEKTLAEDNPRRLGSQHELAIAYRANGQVKKAVDLLKHVVAVQEKTLAEDHPDRLASQQALARAYRANGQVKKAVDLLKHVVAVQEKTLAEDHPSRLASQQALARAYRANGQVKKAVDLLKHVVEVKATFMSPGHPSRIVSEEMLARMRSEAAK